MSTPIIRWLRHGVLAIAVSGLAHPLAADQSIARIWDEEILAGIRLDTPNPPVHARNLFHLSVAMYDTWAAYDPVSVGYLYRGKHTAPDIATARREAISFAAYRILKERYALSKTANTTLFALDARMVLLGYDSSNRSLDPSTPAGLGNLVAATVSSYYLADGSRQAQGYADLPASQGGYVSLNPPLVVFASGTLAVAPNYWQPLAITNAVDQHNLPTGVIQQFIGAQWRDVRPFALDRDAPNGLWIDPGPPPHLGGRSDAEYRSNVVEVIRRSSQLTPDDGVMVDISPEAFGNNSLGANDGTGHPLNPVTGQPYPPNVVKRGDYARVLAEFWADGPTSETPPGHWNVIANQVSDHPGFVKRIGGTGPVVDNLEWDVKVYLAVNAAVHDAACAAWTLKRYYDGWRPIEAIRYLAQRGQSTDPTQPFYFVGGINLVPGLIEVVTAETAQPGGRHQGLPPQSIAILAWPGQPADPVHQHSGVRWIQAVNWLPYQRKTFVTPAFPGYISGHSTFSRAAAEVLTAITGSPFFPGGMGTYTAAKDTGLGFEQGPSAEVQLQWGTYYDASDQAGISRLWGGIHPPADDLPGRRVGSECGKADWALASRYFDGTIDQTPIAVSLRPTAPAGREVRFSTLRGFYYKLQSTAALDQPFTDEPGAPAQATDSSEVRADPSDGPQKFYRVIRTPTP